MRHRPCGACRELVPAETGCQHWRPGETTRAAEGRERRRKDREALDEFRRQMGVR